MRVGLVGCVKSKGFFNAPARDLYISTLFKGRRRYVESSCDRWFVLSAKHGLVDPQEIIEPYDVALSQQTVMYQARWSDQVLRQLQEQLGDVSGMTFEIHAGAAYRNSGVAQGLRDLGATVEIPTGDLRFGELLAFYSSGTLPSKERFGPASLKSHSHKRRGRPHSNYDAIGAFLESSKLDEMSMTFAQIEILIGRPLPMSALKYGVWWANSATNPQSQGWVSLGWKVRRIKVEDRKVEFHRERTEHEPSEQVQHAPASKWEFRKSSLIGERQTTSDPQPIVEAMLTYSTALATESREYGISYTPEREANQFLINDPFAFLVGVIFDQGIPAERAWAAPYELSKRLGHLDPRRLAAHPDGIRDAIQARPKLHRFINNLPEWVVLAAEKVVREYGGDAANIWNDGPSARVLQRRLLEFKGIGQKKAAMAVELLEKDFEVQISNLEGSDVAFDVHIRRVFLRTGLGDFDHIDDIVSSARQHHPDRPGSLDGPAWQIGRRWCRPMNPTCSECVLESVCPKFLSRADQVKGV